MPGAMCGQWCLPARRDFACLPSGRGRPIGGPLPGFGGVGAVPVGVLVVPVVLVVVELVLPDSAAAAAMVPAAPPVASAPAIMVAPSSFETFTVYLLISDDAALRPSSTGPLSALLGEAKTPVRVV